MIMPTIPTDTLFSSQWHLRNTTMGQFDLDVVNAWDDFTGKGVKVLVIDDGFEHDHPDLSPNYDITLDHDYGADDDDAAPVFTDGRDNHGTSVMGIIGAAANGTGVVGVAYDATMIGARITYNVTSDEWVADFAAALGDGITNGAQVVNMSFGGAADFDNYHGAINIGLEKDAVTNALANGRDGLGLVMVRSAGNSRSSAIDNNHNQSDNNSGYVIVAAVNRDGFVSSYSSYGSSILVSGFGSPLSGEIVTTDRLGSAGYDPGDFETSFNGTSAAAPMVSGVVALMLEANPNLTWRDVQSILANTARHVGSAVDGVSLAGSEQNPWNFNNASNWNGGGMHFSRDYGYGLVSGHDAVRLAETWLGQGTSGNQKAVNLDLLASAVQLVDGDTTGMTFNKTVNANIDVERVTLTLDFASNRTPDLDIFITGPDGQEQKLMLDQGNHFGTTFSGSFTMHSQAFRGESSKGDWSIRLADDLSGNLIDVNDIKLNIFGAAASSNDTYFYTNEFSDFTSTHSPNLFDGNGGLDTLNASPVTSAMIVNLGARTGTIDGVAMQIRGIENVFGGDGNDTLTGSKGGNILAGGRGADDIFGGKGDDHFRLFSVRDSFGGGMDFFGDFGKGDDTFDLRSIDANINTAKNDKFKFIGEHDLTNVAGQFHFHRDKMAGITYAGGDVDGDGVVDLIFSVDGVHKFVKGDFDL
jgi:subtilisin-like proprotein convertase family protein